MKANIIIILMTAREGLSIISSFTIWRRWRRRFTAVREKILAIEDISYDNVVLIYQQLVGSMIKTLVGERVQISRFLGNGRKVYTTIAELDTIEEIEDFVKDFVGQLREYLEEGTEEKEEEQLYERILAFLDIHYREDIDFEETAGKMGISYSHMRHVMREKRRHQPYGLY